MPRFVPIPSDIAAGYRAGLPDANGQPPEHAVSDGDAPCRHCLRPIPAGAAMLVLAYRPFPRPQPYAEIGPIFLCAADCAAWAAGVPPMLSSPDYVLRAYGADDRIRYGTGAVVPTAEIAARADVLLADPAAAYLHIRSARNTCFQCRVER